MGLLNKFKTIEKEKNDSPDLLKAYKEFDVTGDKSLLQKELQKTAELFIKEVKHCLNKGDIILASVYKEDVANTLLTIQDIVKGKLPDRKVLNNISFSCNSVCEKQASPSRKLENLKKVSVIYDSILENIPTGEYLSNELKTSIKNGTVKHTLTDDGILFESKAFKEPIKCEYMNNIKDPNFYAGQLAYEALNMKTEINVNMLTEKNANISGKGKKETVNLEIER